MRQIVFISGKGGTGKSTIVASLSEIVKNKMLADCDVEAQNLHIIIDNEPLKKWDFFGAKEAKIDPKLCDECGLCMRACRFDAISDDYEIKPMKCEGCGACVLVCPQGAIELEYVKTGETYISNTPVGILSHAQLDIGAEGSGKLVTEVRKNAKDHGKDERWLLIDGSPGTGCVVIASITGADAVVVVSEPTMSGLEDLRRVLGVAEHFGIPAFVCINKYDLNLKITSEIEQYCWKNRYPVIGKIPFDPSVVEALRNFQTPVQAKNVVITREIERLWARLTDRLGGCNSGKTT